MTSSAVWDTRFLTLARLVSSWSKDPSTQCGAVLARPDKTIAGIGFNGLPRNTIDHENILDDRSQKYPNIIHAEWNAIRSSRDSDKNGYTCYSWPLPSCSECTAALLQSGVRRIVHGPVSQEQKERWAKSFAIASAMQRDVHAVSEAAETDPGVQELIDMLEQAPPPKSREEVWDRRYITVAKIVEKWCKDDGVSPNACVLVRPDKTLAAIGFAGLPRGVSSGHSLCAAQNALLFCRDFRTENLTAYCSSKMSLRAVAHLVQDSVKTLVAPLSPGPSRQEEKDEEKAIQRLLSETGGEQRFISIEKPSRRPRAGWSP